MSSEKKSVMLEIITPREMLYSGRVEMLMLPTQNGQEGFLPGHIWCVKLLAETGLLKFREAGSTELKTVQTSGGYADIRDTFVVYTDGAKWA